MSNTVDPSRLKSITAQAASTAGSASTAAGGGASSSSAVQRRAEYDTLEAANRGRQWFEETQGKHVNPTPGSTGAQAERQEYIRVSDLLDTRKRA